MKIICDNCRTKYSIADEKVKGKVFKIRCKKCQNIIVVRGNQGEAGGAFAQSEQVGTEEELMNNAVSGGSGDYKDSPIWHLVIGREQVGPMSSSEVRDKFARREIDADSYIWREGFSDWVRISTLEDFSDLFQSVRQSVSSELNLNASQQPMADWGPTTVSAQPISDNKPLSWNQDGRDNSAGGGMVWDASANSNESPWNPAAMNNAGAAEARNLFGGSISGGDMGQDLFGSQPGDANLERGADGGMQFNTAENMAGSDGLFGTGAAASSGDLFQGSGNGGGQATFPSDGGGGGSSMQMTGARHENSVLFSLANLQALAMGGKSDTPSALSLDKSPSNSGDGSGLIDIRSMAVPSTNTRANKSGAITDLPDLGGFSAPIGAAPVLLPALTSERPKWLFPVIGIGAALVLGVFGLIIVLVTRPEPKPVVLANNISGQPVVGALTKNIDKSSAENKGTEASNAVDSEKGNGIKEANTAEERDADKGAVAKRKKLAVGKGRGLKGKKGTLVAQREENNDSTDSNTVSPRAVAKKNEKRDALDDLIDGAISGNKKGARIKPKAEGGASSAGSDSNLPETLSRADIVAGMRKIRGRVQECYDKYHVPGTAFTQVTIGKDGHVKSSKVTGMFAGTPTGACLQAASRTAVFPRFRGSPVTIDFPFILR